jgi:hypothetical protein
MFSLQILYSAQRELVVPKIEELRSWINLNGEELHNLYSAADIC